MWGVALAAALAYSLVRLAATAAERKEASLRARLYKLEMPGRRLTLADAEDGAVLARRFGKSGSEKMFRKAIRDLKK